MRATPTSPRSTRRRWPWSGKLDRRPASSCRTSIPASKRAMEFVAGLDADGDGWPEGLGNVEREGMGEEKLDNAVYTIRGYADLADMAAAVGDNQTRRWAVGKARALLQKFEADWWYGGDTRSYADSLDDPGNNKVFQRHWIGLTPTDAVLPRLPGRAAGPLASEERRQRDAERARTGLLQQRARASTTPAPVRLRLRPATRAPPVTRSYPQCPASATSSPSILRSPRSARATTVAWVRPSRGSTPPATPGRRLDPRPLGDARHDAGDRAGW